MNLKRPADHESNDYFKLYINQVPGNDFLQTLKAASATTVAFLQNLDSAKWNHRYAPGKWSIKEVLIHLIDTERVFCYRALRISRNDQTPLPGFEHNDYVAHYDVENRSAASIIEEFESVRQATIGMFKHFNEDMLERIGTASGNHISVRALGYIIAGHEAHHLRLFRERYLV